MCRRFISITCTVMFLLLLVSGLLWSMHRRNLTRFESSWARVQVGMTMLEIEQLLGEPESTVLWWGVEEWAYRNELNVNFTRKFPYVEVHFFEFGQGAHVIEFSADGKVTRAYVVE